MISLIFMTYPHLFITFFEFTTTFIHILEAGTFFFYNIKTIRSVFWHTNIRSPQIYPHYPQVVDNSVDSFPHFFVKKVRFTEIFHDSTRIKPISFIFFSKSRDRLNTGNETIL